MNIQDFLLEIRTEEIPAPALLSARTELARRLADALAEEGLAPSSSESYATPRRLAAVLRGIPERQEDRSAEVLGPPASTAFDADGKPTKAGEGFAKAQKVNVADLVVVDSPRGRTVAARKSIPGRPAEEVLAEVVPRVVAGLTFPKMMRWGAGERAFVRPVRGVVALFGGHVVPLELFGVAASDRTLGHRVLSEGEIHVTGPDDYLVKLRIAFVEPDAEARRIRILETARRLASEVGGQIEAHADLANTLADLVEWPGLVRGVVCAGVPGAARGDHRHRHAHAPEVRPGARSGGPASALHRGHGQHRGPQGLHREGQRVGAERAPGGRALLLRDGRAGAARGAAAAAFAPDLPGQARRLPPEDVADPGSRRGDRAPDRPRGPRRVGAHGGAAFEGGPEHARRQGIHGPAGNHGRHLRPPRAVPGRGVEGGLRPVPSGLRIGRSAARGLRRDPLARRPVRLALRALPDRARPDGIEGPVRSAPRGPRRGRDRDLAQLAHGLAPDRAQGAVPAPGEAGRARTTSRRSKSSAASSPSGCAACSSGAATRTTRSRRS